jgi:hypothetical protein
MKKLALLSFALLIATLGAYSATVRSKSNISNNREAACHGTVTGEPGHQKLVCSGKCPDGKCDVHTVDVEGGTRSWCGCTKEEPKDCHVVLHTAKGGKTSAQCSATTPCAKPKSCKQIESKSGITCDCQ